MTADSSKRARSNSARASKSASGSGRHGSEDRDPVLPRIARGEEPAVQECVDQYGALIWSLARRLSPSPADAEDAVQEIFIDLWKNADRFDSSKGSETTFIAMIARRRLIDRLRKFKRQPTTEGIPESDFLAAEVSADRVEIEDEAAHLAEYVQKLKPQQQEVLRLSVHHGWSQQKISEYLSLPLGTVKTHVRRALIKVRELAARDGIVAPEELPGGAV